MPEVDPYAEFRVSPPPAAPAADDPYAEFRTKPAGDSGVPTDYKGIIVPVAPPKPVAPPPPQRDFAGVQPGTVAPGTPDPYAAMINTPGALPLTSQDQAAQFFPKKIPDYGSVGGKHPIQIGPITAMVSDEQDPSGSTSADIGKSIGSGLTSGIEGLAGVPAGLEKLAGYAAQLPGRFIGGMTSEDFAKRETVAHPLVSPEGLESGAKAVGEWLTGGAGDYQPSTTGGDYAKSISEMVPGAVTMGPEGLAQKILMSVGGGTGAEFLAKKFKGTPYEGFARFVGSIIGAGGASKLASKVSPTAKAIFGEHLKGTSPEDLVRTVALMTDAAAKGIKLSVAQALSWVQGGPGPLSNLQRYIEESRGGGPTMRKFYQDQPQQVATAVEREVGTTAPQTLDPVEAGKRVQAAAQGAIDRARSGTQITPQPMPGVTPTVPPGLAERPAVTSAMRQASDIAANEGRPLPMITRDEAGNVVPDNAAKTFAAGSRQRLDRAIEQAFGDRGTLAEGDRMVTLRREESADPYARADAQAIPRDEIPIDLIDRLRAWGVFQEVTQRMNRVGRPFNVGRLEVWDRMKRRLDARITNALQKGARDDVRDLRDLRTELVTTLDRAIPDYAEARQIYAGHSEMLDALEAGRRALSPTVTREQVAREFAAINTQGELAAYRQGYGNALREKLARTGDNADLPHAIAGNEQIRAKTAIIAPPQGAQAMDAAIANEERQFTQALEPDTTAWKRAHDILSEKAAAAGEPQAAGLQAAAEDVRGVVTQDPNMRRALTLSGQIARRDLAPLEQGVPGKLAKTDESKAQISKLFADEPQAGEAPVVGNAVRTLVKQDPEAAISIVGQHILTVFSEAISSKQGVPNQWGGARFFDQLMGNPEQAKVLEEAVRALPAGNVRWEGFRRLMDSLEAIGHRLHPGSPTESKRLLTEQLQKGGTVKGLAADVAVGGLHIPARLRKAYDYLRLGRNAEQLAKLLTDSSSVGLFGRLVKLPPGSLAENSLIDRLVGIAAPELTKEPGKRPANQAAQ